MLYFNYTVIAKNLLVSNLTWIDVYNQRGNFNLHNRLLHKFIRWLILQERRKRLSENIEEEKINKITIFSVVAHLLIWIKYLALKSGKTYKKLLFFWWLCWCKAAVFESHVWAGNKRDAILFFFSSVKECGNFVDTVATDPLIDVWFLCYISFWTLEYISH